MHYSEMKIPREVIREALLNYLRENINQLRLSPPAHFTGADRIWFDGTRATGKRLPIVIEQVYENLLASKKILTSDVPVNDSTLMHAYNAYHPLRIKEYILEELMELVRIGILLQMRFKPTDPDRNFDFTFETPSETVMLSDFGIRFLQAQTASPYFIEAYLGKLDEISSLNDELRGYLSEGMMCLRHQLARASALLLRLAAENTLTRLIDEVQNALPSKPQKDKFKASIRNAGIRIEERAEIVFQALEHGELLQNNNRLRDDMRHQLKAAFHSIRASGGRAAHLSDRIEASSVADNYVLFANSVYPIMASLFKHLQQVQSPSDSSSEL